MFIWKESQKNALIKNQNQKTLSDPEFEKTLTRKQKKTKKKIFGYWTKAIQQWARKLMADDGKYHSFFVFDSFSFSPFKTKTSKQDKWCMKHAMNGKWMKRERERERDYIEWMEWKLHNHAYKQ